MTKSPNERQQEFRRVLGAEIRALREAAGESQRTLGDLFDWNRDAFSKIERGRVNMCLYDYLVLMRFLRTTCPTHPAVALADHLFGYRGVPNSPP